MLSKIIKNFTIEYLNSYGENTHQYCFSIRYSLTSKVLLYNSKTNRIIDALETFFFQFRMKTSNYSLIIHVIRKKCIFYF